MKQSWEKEFDKKFGLPTTPNDAVGIALCKRFIHSLLSAQKTAIVKGFEDYKCDFNWDFKKNKEKHTSYISLSDAIALIEKL